MKTKAVLHERILDYFDGPLAIEARDEDGRRYLCDSMGAAEAGEQWIVVPITDDQADALNRGEMCLRSTMVQAGGEEWYISVPQWDFREPFTIEPQEGPISESPELPGEGYMLTGAWDDE